MFISSSTLAVSNFGISLETKDPDQSDKRKNLDASGNSHSPKYQKMDQTSSTSLIIKMQDFSYAIGQACSSEVLLTLKGNNHESNDYREGDVVVFRDAKSILRYGQIEKRIPGIHREPIFQEHNTVKCVSKYEVKTSKDSILALAASILYLSEKIDSPEGSFKQYEEAQLQDWENKRNLLKLKIDSQAIDKISKTSEMFALNELVIVKRGKNPNQKDQSLYTYGIIAELLGTFTGEEKPFYKIVLDNPQSIKLSVKLVTATAIFAIDQEHLKSLSH